MWRRAGSVLHLTPRQVKLDVVLSNGLRGRVQVTSVAMEETAFQLRRRFEKVPHFLDESERHLEVQEAAAQG